MSGRAPLYSKPKCNLNGMKNLYGVHLGWKKYIISIWPLQHDRHMGISRYPYHVFKGQGILMVLQRVVLPVKKSVYLWIMSLSSTYLAEDAYGLQLRIQPWQLLG